eukprot:COSAG06_NODE_112_length_23474_cov_81.804458_5_plen_607_part_00
MKKLKRWYTQTFLQRPNVRTTNPRDLDAQRANWCTPENFEENYQIWADAHVAAGIAYVNPTFDAACSDMDDPKSQQILFHADKLYRSASFDETRLEGDTGAGRKAKTERLVTVGDDDGEALSARGAASMTGIGGCFLDCQPLCPVYLPKGQSVDYAAIADHLPVMKIDGESVTGQLLPTAGGGMTDAIIKDVMEKSIVWRWRKKEGDDWNKNTHIITTDGVGTHISVAFLRWCLENKVVLLLRCPYGSSKQQPEDILLFLRLKNNSKNGFYKMKKQELGRQYLESCGNITALDIPAIAACVKESWQDTFAPQHLAKALRLGGYVPFNRKPYWDLLAASKRATAAVTELSKITDIFKKTKELNYGGMLQKLLRPSQAGASRKKTGRHAALTGSDLAFLPGGASTAEGVRLAAFKHAVGAIKNMKVGAMKKALEGFAEHFGSDQMTGPYLTARLLLVVAFEAGFGIMPKSWISSKDKADVRAHLATEGIKMDITKMKIDSAKRDAAKKIVKYWEEEAERVAEAATQGVAAEDPESDVSIARAALTALFGGDPRAEDEQEDEVEASSDAEEEEEEEKEEEERRSKRRRVARQRLEDDASYNGAQLASSQ